VKFSKVPELKKLVTFIPNKIEPIHNWYYFKEGFSKQLVDIFLDRFNLNENSIVLDPFCGVGTTLLTCKQRGIKSTGFDVSPLFIFISKVKTRDYDLDELRESVKEALKWKFERPKKIPKEKYIKRAFSKYTLEDIIFYKNKILEIEDDKIRDFFLLALIDSSIKSGWVLKDGAVVKIEKKGKPPLKKYFKYKIRKMLKDVERTKIKPVNTIIEVGDARNISLDDSTIDAVITSPPYLNKIEYTKIYKIETFLFFNLPQTELKSYVASRVEDTDVSGLGLDENLPLIAKKYFKDMDKVFKELYRVCKDDSELVVVVGGGCFPDRVVEADRITAEIAEKNDFKVKNILIVRDSWCTRARTIKVGKIRESIILLKK